jgi:hypothetical protein
MFSSKRCSFVVPGMDRFAPRIEPGSNHFKMPVLLNPRRFLAQSRLSFPSPESRHSPAGGRENIELRAFNNPCTGTFIISREEKLMAI